MHGDIFLLIVFVLLALLVSFLCSIAETVLLSVTPSYIEGLKVVKPKRAKLLERLKISQLDRSLAAILTLNTIAHTIGAIGAGAKATSVFGSTWFGVFSAFMTFMILFFSEIVPKTIGAVFWPRLTFAAAMFVSFLIVTLYPVVWLSELVTRLLVRGRNIHLFSREEFIAMMKIGERSGGIQRNESRIIRNLLKYDSLRIDEIMTPRTVISALPESACVDEILDLITDSPFSRLPVYRDSLDDVSGFVLKADVLAAKANGDNSATLSELKREILTVPKSLQLSVLFDRLLRGRQHIALVIDEYGGTSGVVTLEDLLETLLGMEIMDETDSVEDMRLLAQVKWMERAAALGIHHEKGGAGRKPGR